MPRNPNRTKFITVRFGNVLGSSGSVIPLFHRQIAKAAGESDTSGDDPLFHDHSRSLHARAPERHAGNGGEIFVLDMANRSGSWIWRAK